MAATDAKGIRWGLERRLEFIEYRLFWEGGINRSDIVDEFGVSVPQASKDLALYQAQASDNIGYDRSQKRYFASASFRPKFIQLDAAAYLHRLALSSRSHHVGRVDLGLGALSADTLPIPQRRIKADVLRSLLACVRESSSIEILYQSMSNVRPEPMWRRISPHAFGSDGLRWHVRGFCHIDQKYKDFILSRCLDTRAIDQKGRDASEDISWNTHFSVLLAPNPQLNASQQGIIAEDYGMRDGVVTISVRRAMLYYFTRRLRLDVAACLDDPRETPVIVRNLKEFDAALAEAVR